MTEVHGACGLWSIIALGIFDLDYGLFYTGNTDQIGIQLAGALAFIGWALMLSFMFFYSLKRNQRLRVDFMYEVIGLDFVKDQSDGSLVMSLLHLEERNETIRQL